MKKCFLSTCHPSIHPSIQVCELDCHLSWLNTHACMHGQLTSPCSTSGMCAFQSNLLLPFLAQLSMIITTQKQTKNTHTHTHTHTHIHTNPLTTSHKLRMHKNHIIFHKFFTKLKFFFGLAYQGKDINYCVSIHFIEYIVVA
jgi:hypothetical protein